MKKNFLKKLSFVLASAMVVSVVTPAASAFAAASVKLNATKKYLHLDVDGKNEYDFNIKGKQTGWKYLWESSNEDVAVVNEKNGVVTATGVGTAKVSVVITDKKGKEVDELKATVVVRDNIKEVSFANKPEGDKLAVGEKFDFNRNFVTKSGSTKKTSAVTRWTVEPTTGATIDNSGVFVATKAGEYTVTARSFQSTAKYNEWKADPAAKASLVLASASYKLTVAPSIKEVAQVDRNTIKVTFDSAVEKVKENLVVSQVLNGAKVKQTIEKIDMNEDNTVATVKVFLPLTGEKTYAVDFTGMDSKTLTAATSKVADVAAIKITTTKAVYGDRTKVEFALLNKDGVDITTDELRTRVTIKSAGEAGVNFVDNTNDERYLWIYNRGASAKLTATFHTWEYDANGNEKGILEAVATIVGVEADSQNLTGLTAWTIGALGDTPNFGDVKHVIAAEEPGRRLFVEMSYTKGSKTDKLNSKDDSKFGFKSSDETILIVDNNGSLFPVRAGAVTVVVTYKDGNGNAVPVATVPVTVSPKSTATNITVDTQGFNLSNAAAAQDSKTVNFTVTDQTNRGKVENFTVKKISSSTGKDLILDKVEGYTGNDGKASVTFSAAGVDKGSYTYEIKVAGMARRVTINVLEPSTGDVAEYRLELSTNEIDTKVVSWDANTQNQAVTINLVGYASNGVKKVKINLADQTDNFFVKVEAPSNPHTGFGDDDNNNGSFKVVVTDPATSLVYKAKEGSYKVTAYEKKDSGDVPLYIASFVVKDTQPKAVLSKVESYGYATAPTVLSNETALPIVKNAFEFAVNGTPIKKENIVSVNVTGTPDRFTVVSVNVLEEVGSAKVQHTVSNIYITLEKN